ncbi:hypothetical protein [Afipia sp. GAS231]|uniref:hypothetical protein n=1 Tax=Afipia sp. GAS231 TaxID=1882747 RepID=UPI00087C10BB|nr:hypothetical protein [Afipia sp. GAS231]SDN39487.1 hypothetical protein SAMN05444050_1461 [Afipia sp. GAS231]
MKAGDEFDGQIGSDQACLDGGRVSQESLRTRKLTVHLSETMFERLKAATDRPGVGKSMVIETALERFLDPAPSVEDRFREDFDRIGSQLGRLQSEIRIVAETAALHARYHLTVTPPMPQSLQREACALGRDRFNELAEQVDRRVRSSRPLMQETIDRLADRRTSQVKPDNILPAASRERSVNAVSQPDLGGDLDRPIAAVREDGSNPNFRHLPNAFC